MSRCLMVLLTLVALCSAAAAAETVPPKTDEAVYRDPFTLKLHVDSDQYYEQECTNRIPYVIKGDVYLFSGESFGINARIENGDITQISYQPDLEKADVEFRFSQELQDDGKSEMLLVIKNRLKDPLLMNALMTMPGRNGVYKTSILPVPAGLSSYESWSHPIVQLVLRNFRLTEMASTSNDEAAKE